MAFEDRYGLGLSTRSEIAAQRYREGIDLLLSAWPGASEALDAAIEADPISRWPMRPARGPI